MVLYVIAKKADKVVVEMSIADIPTGEGSTPETGAREEWFAEKAIKHGLTIEEVSCASFPQQDKIDAFNDDHSYELFWSESDISDIIFDVLDKLNWLQCIVDERVIAGGATTIRVESLLPDKSDIDTSDNSEIDAVIETPNGPMPICLQLTAGVAEFDYTMQPGFYTIPNNKFDNYRIVEVKRVKCVIKLTA